MPREDPSDAAAGDAALKRWRRLRSPLAWMLPPALGGILLASWCGGAAWVWCCAAGAGLAGALCMSAAGRAGRLRMGFLVLACTGAWGAWMRLCEPGLPPPSAARPPIEGVFMLDVERRFQSRPPLPGRRPRVSGVGVVSCAPGHLSGWTGQRLAFSLDVRDAAAVRECMPGARMGVRGVLEPVDPGAGPGSFDCYLVESGVRFRLRRGEAWPYPGSAGFLREWLRDLGDRAERSLRMGVPRADSDLQVAMLLGRRESMDPALRDAFLRTGTMHLFSISGLHVAVIAGIVYMLGGLLRLPERAAFLSGMAFLAIYVGVAGAPSSAVRAWIMVGVLWAARAWWRPQSAFSALVAASLVSLAMDPRVLWNAGFQLSYVVVGGILLYGMPLSDVLVRACEPFRMLEASSWKRRHHAVRGALRWLSGSFAVSLAATVCSAPLVSMHFGLVAMGGMLFNLACIPLASLILVGAFASVASGMPGLGFLAGHFNFANLVLGRLLEAVVVGSAASGGGCVEVRASPLSAGVGLVLVFAACMVAPAFAPRLRRPWLVWCAPPLVSTAWLAFEWVRVGCG